MSRMVRFKTWVWAPLAALAGGLVMAAAAITPQSAAFAQSSPATCVSSYQSDGTIYIHNGCEQDVYWMACVRTQGWTVTHSYDGPGILAGTDYDFSPANDQTPFSYSLLTAYQPTNFQCGQ